MNAFDTYLSKKANNFDNIDVNRSSSRNAEVIEVSDDDNSNNNTMDMDLTADVDTWRLCGLPNDGRTYMQCSREDRSLGAKDGWFHGECLQTAGWSKPRRSQKNWLCQSCHVFENGI